MSDCSLQTRHTHTHTILLSFFLPRTWTRVKHHHHHQEQQLLPERVSIYLLNIEKNNSCTSILICIVSLSVVWSWLVIGFGFTNIGKFSHLEVRFFVVFVRLLISVIAHQLQRLSCAHTLTVVVCIMETYDNWPKVPNNGPKSTESLSSLAFVVIQRYELNG